MKRISRHLPGDLHRYEIHELIQMCRHLEENVQGRWTTPILNDFYVMMMNGRVYRALKKSGVDKPEVLQNNLMAGEEGIESTEPTKFLLRLCDVIREKPELQEIFQHEHTDIYDILQKKDPSFFESCLEYIEKYGDRTMGELKLESITLRQDPSFMFSVIKNYLKNDNLTLATLGEREGQLRQEAEDKAYGLIKKKK